MHRAQGSVECVLGDFSFSTYPLSAGTSLINNEKSAKEKETTWDSQESDAAAKEI